MHGVWISVFPLVDLCACKTNSSGNVDERFLLYNCFPVLSYNLNSNFDQDIEARIFCIGSYRCILD